MGIGYAWASHQSSDKFIQMETQSLRALKVLFMLMMFSSLNTFTDESYADIIISELLASNPGTFLDEDGDSSDLFELFNSGTSTVDLDGWFVTDDEDDLTQWSIPDVSLAPGEFLVLFASGKDRRDPNFELHTNFELRASGDYLGLVEPDGTTIHFQYAPEYPHQLPGISYGILQAVQESGFVEEGDSCRYLVPAPGNSSLAWTEVDFDDQGWTQAPAPVGFDTSGDYDSQISTDIDSSMRGVNSSVYLRFPFQVDDVDALDQLSLFMKFDDGFSAFINGQPVASRHAPQNLDSGSNATEEHGTPLISTMTQDFDGGGTSYVLTAHSANNPPVVRNGGPTGSYLELLELGNNSTTNSCGFQVVPGPTQAIFCEFDYRMPVEGRADGFGFALLETDTWNNNGPGPNVGFVWERPQIDAAFAVGFDIWPAGDENSVNLNWNGSEQISHFIDDFELHNGVFNRVNLELIQDGSDTLVTMRITRDVHGNAQAPYTAFENFRISGMNIAECRVAFGGRTGGANTGVDLDNIKVDFTPGSSQLEYEEFNLTDSLDVLQNGENVLAIQGLNFTDNDSDFLLAAELYGLSNGSSNTSVRQFFPEPTPGEFNGEGLNGVVNRPFFSRNGGAFSSSFNLNISSTTPGSEIHYTVNGTEPTKASPRLDGVININGTTLIRARAFADGMVPSVIIDQSYVRVSSGLSNFSSDLPIFLVNTFGKSISSSYPAGSNNQTHFLVIPPDLGGRAHITGQVDFSGFGAIKTRGSSTGGRSKASYGFEIRDEEGEDLGAEILGFPEESDWILYGPYNFDRALIRNAFIYDLSNQIGRYAVRSQFCELYVNTSTSTMSDSHYRGLYVFMEKIKRDRNRVDIEALRPSHNSVPEIQGGWILKIDRADPGDNGFGGAGQTLRFVEPKEEDVTSAQRTWIQNWMNQFGNALNGPNFTDPDIGYRAYFDVPNAVDHHLLNVLALNVDALRLSTYMHKPRFGKLTFGPIWDFDRSMGSYDGRDDNPEAWSGSGGTNFFTYPWWSRLFQDPDFWQEYRDRWEELRQDEFSIDNVFQTIDGMGAECAEAAERNFDRWGSVPPRNGSYQAELNFLKDWLERRILWIDSQFPRPPGFSEPSQVIDPGFEVALGAPTGSIYYTLDGSDPRLPGGGISPTAEEYGTSNSAVLVSPDLQSRVRYRVPTSDAEDDSWTAINFNDNHWELGTNGIGVGYERSSGYQDFFQNDVEADMYDTTTSVYIRIEFDLDDPDGFAFMNLGMMYDDGFTAYLNGHRIAGSNDPDNPEWDSNATDQNGDGAATSFQPFNVTEHIDKLVQGTNVLAIHGLNFNTTSSDLLFVPMLSASGVFTGDPITLNDYSKVFARTKIGNDWSGPSIQIYPTDDAMDLRVTEMMYHPEAPEEGSLYKDEDFEFIEVQNVGTQTIDLRGVQFVRGIDFDFSDASIQSILPGEIIVLVSHLEAFETRYNINEIPVVGEYRGNLENQGEMITLVNGADEIIQEFTYDDAWYPETDGVGFSLSILDPLFELELWNEEDSWEVSSDLGGSPGVGDSFEGGRRLPGDANQDSHVDLGDAITLLLAIYRGDQVTLPCEEVLDSEGNRGVLDHNGDATIDQSDAVSLLSYLYLDGPPHVLGGGCVRIVGCEDLCDL